MKSLNSLVIFMAVLLFSPTLHAQTEADSLRFVSMRDSVEKFIGVRDLDNALAASEHMFQQAQAMDYHFFEISAYFQMSRVYQRMTRSDLSQEVLKKAYAIALNNNMPKSEATAAVNLGIAYFQDSMYDSTVWYFKKSIELSREHNPERLALNMSNLAWIYGVMDDRELEFEAYLASYKALEDRPDSYRANRVKTMTLGGLGDYYVYTGDYDKAREYFEEKLQLGIDIESITTQFEAHAGLGTLFRMDDNYDFEKSKFHYEFTALTEETGVEHYKYQAMQGLAKLHRKEGNYEQSLSYFREVYDFYNSIDVPDFSASAATAIGELYLELNQLNESGRWLNIAVDGTKKNNLIARERDALWSLYKVDSLRGRYRSALAGFQRLNLIEDSLSNERSRDRIKELEIQFETEQTEKENLTLKSDLELQKAQMERQQIIQIFVAVVALTFIILATIVYRSYKRKKKDNETISQQANELKTLSRFKEGLTSMVVHDMRNPLNAILGFSQGTPTDDKQRNINRSGHQVLNLVNNMLDIQRFEEAKVELSPETLDARELVGHCIQEVTLLAASKSLRVVSRVPDALRFRADPVLVNRIIVNLLINSVKYSKSGTEIVVEAGKGQGGFQQLVVKDEGHGIPPEQLPFIFEKFWHNDPEKSGVLPSTGLGLSFCKMATEAHGGDIYVESVLHEGTSIFFSLPLAEGVGPVENTVMEQVVPENALNDVDMDVYRTYLPKLEKLEVFEVSEINKLLKALEGQVKDKNLGRQLRTAAFQGDQSLYNQLLDQLREEKLA